MKNVTINNNEIVRFATILSQQKGESFDAIVEKLLEKAMKDMQYRSRRNAQKWQETKALKETVAALEEQLIRINTREEVGRGHEELIQLDDEQ